MPEQSLASNVLHKSGPIMKGRVSNILRYAIHDGPGIRTLVFLKGCPLRCIWCSNPESQRPSPELMLTPSRCIGCGLCKDVCPSGVAPGRGSECQHCNNMPCVQACYAQARKIVGRDMSVEDVFDIVMQDRIFYENSGGGITVSGGEPFMQSSFLGELLEYAKQHNIDTAVETCGAVPCTEMVRLFPLIDHLLFDIKHYDNEKHMQYCGAGNKNIWANLRALSAIGPDKIIMRIPLIPGINDSEKNIDASADLAYECGISEIHLLPYHRLGEKKYKELGLEVPFQSGQIERNRLEEFCGIIEKRGIRCKLNG